jgi:hypothetical protein
MAEKRGHTVRIGGNVDGQVAVGDNNVQHSHRGQDAPADVAELRAQLDELRALIDSPEGSAKLDELEEALSGDEVDVATVEHVDGWFRRKLPRFSAAVHRVVVGPTVAKLVEAGGDELVAEFTRRFGGS